MRTATWQFRWGFEGDFAAQNMMTAFGKASIWCAHIPMSRHPQCIQVAHTPEVYELSLEIDKLLRITSGSARLKFSSLAKNYRGDQLEPHCPC